MTGNTKAGKKGTNKPAIQGRKKRKDKEKGIENKLARNRKRGFII
jgi:hypothetical protein